jgi:hypothetical protein
MKLGAHSRNWAPRLTEPSPLLLVGGHNRTQATTHVHEELGSKGA